MKNNLFNQALMKKYAKDKAFDLTVSKHDFIKKHAEKVENGDFKSEVSSYLYFYDFLKEILGYDREENILFGEKEDTGRGISEFALKSEDKKFMVIELKDQTTDLDKPQTRAADKRTPVDQAFDYAQHSGDINWIFVSNFKEFRLYNWGKKSDKYISFSYKDLLKHEKFRFFMLSFSRRSHIDKGYPAKILKETLIIEEKFEDNFYNLFHNTRLMLIKELEDISGFNREQAIEYAQMILNRYMFICFAEDMKDEDLLPSQISTQTILKPIQDGDIGKNTIWNRLNELFTYINEGNDFKNINKYNGGLFEEELGFIQIRDLVEDRNFFEDNWQKSDFKEYSEDIKKLIGPHHELINPIYKNLLLISRFDFSSELDVNILGHVFENSIGDLEELKADTKGRRKKEGIFYTPDYITDYICRNTIIPYLSRSGDVNNIHDLISEYSHGREIEDLDLKLKDIKIVDPACGSGAFLNKATDILLNIHRAIFEFKKGYTKRTEMKVGKGKRRKKEYVKHIDLAPIVFDAIDKRREILLKNIFGVDLNEESVDITKLGLFLKVCKKGLELPNLDKNIRCGNSIVDDLNLDKKAFEWKKEFKEIFDNGGFDIVIGNPPWSAKISTEVNKILADSLGWPKKNVNICALFVHESLKKLSEEGIFGFLLPKVVIKNKSYFNVREEILELYQIREIADIGKFPGVASDAISLVIENRISGLKKTIIKFFTDNEVKENIIDQDIFMNNPLNVFSLSLTPEIQKVLDKITKGSKKLSSFVEIKRGIELGQKSPVVKCVHCGRFNEAGLKYYGVTDKKCKSCGKLLDLKKAFSISSIEKTDFYTEKCVSGTQIQRYQIKDYYYIPEDLKGINYKRDIFRGNKILIKRISTKIEGTFTDEDILAFNTVYSLFNNKLTKECFFYFLGILNSNLINFFFEFSYNVGMNLTTQVTIDFLSSLPIKIVTGIRRKKIIEKTESLLKLNQKVQNESNDFKGWLMREYNIEKLSKNLEEYYKFGYEEFLNEIKNKTTNLKSRKNQELLENEFNDSLSVIKPLIQKIEETTREIDQTVYELYGLTDEEVQILKNEYKR